MSPSQFLERANPKVGGLTAKKIGKAFTKIAEYDKRLSQKRTKYGKMYFLPPIRRMEEKTQIYDWDLLDTPEDFVKDNVGRLLIEEFDDNQQLKQKESEQQEIIKNVILSFTKREQTNLIDRLELRQKYEDVEVINQWLAR